MSSSRQRSHDLGTGKEVCRAVLRRALRCIGVEAVGRITEHHAKEPHDHGPECRRNGERYLGLVRAFCVRESCVYAGMGCSAAVCFLSALRHCAAVPGAGGSVHHIHSCSVSKPAGGGASGPVAGARHVRSQPSLPTLRTSPQSRLSIPLDSWQWFAVARIRPARGSRDFRIHGQLANKRSEATCESARTTSVTLAGKKPSLFWH
jgi:hypothetical protein